MRASLACAAVALAAVVPPATGFPARVDALAGGLYLAAAAAGLGVVAGIAGLPSLAQGGFVAVGAFTSALLRLDAGLPLGPAVIAGAAVAALIALLAGAATVRLEPALFAVATWLLSWLALEAAQAFPLFGGTEGRVVEPALSDRAHYEVALALTTVCALTFVALKRSPAGLRLAAARGRPAGAVAAGVPVNSLRLQAFVLAATIAGLAGGLSVDLAGVADPAAYGPSLSLKLLLAVLIGGGASALGGPAGIGVLGLVTIVGRNAAGFSDQLATRIQTVLAAVLILALLPDDPQGLVPTLERRLPSRRRRLAAAPLPPSRPPTALRARGLVKRYGATVALDGLDLDVEPGTIHAIVGRNGSGKTTALRALAGTIALDEGTIALEHAPAGGDERRGALSGAGGAERRGALSGAGGAERRGALSGAGGDERRGALPGADGDERRGALSGTGGAERRGAPSGADGDEHRGSPPAPAAGGGSVDLTPLGPRQRVALGVVRTLQSPGVFRGMSVLENVIVGAAARGRDEGVVRAILATPRQRADAAVLTATAYDALVAVGLDTRAHDSVEHLSTTEQRLLMIAVALATDPAVLLLDEPSSGIGAAELERLAAIVRQLRDRGLAVLLVEHNLRFLHSIADRVTVIDAGRAIASGRPAEVVHDPAVRTAYLGEPAIA